MVLIHAVKNSVKVAGLRPRPAPSFLCAPKETKQRKTPDLLALRIPSIPLHFAAKKKTRACLHSRSNIFLRIPAKFRFTPAASYGKGNLEPCSLNLFSARHDGIVGFIDLSQPIVGKFDEFWWQALSFNFVRVEFSRFLAVGFLDFSCRCLI